MQAGDWASALREAASAPGRQRSSRAARDEDFGRSWHQVGEAVPKIIDSGIDWRVEWVPVLAAGGSW
jgi:hypothetical protein